MVYPASMRIGIAGPGRSGTSLLTLLFSEFGFKTAVETGTYYEEARAGYESRIDATSGFEIDKDPWLFEYINSIPESVMQHYELILLPIRRRQDAVISRVSQERSERIASMPTERWRWNSWGSIPGGSVSGIDFESVDKTLSGGLWDLIEACEKRSIPYLFIHFPRFVEDFDYFWNRLGQFVETKISKEAAHKIFLNVVDVDKIRIKVDETKSPKVLELEAIISNLQRKLHSNDLERDSAIVERDSAIVERDSAIVERDSAIVERDSAIVERDSILSSGIWKATKPYRWLRDKF
jgi:hypothetical protein